jgi:hypothetical protein
MERLGAVPGAAFVPMGRGVVTDNFGNCRQKCRSLCRGIDSQPALSDNFIDWKRQ